MLLHLQTWPEVETYLKRSTAIIVPIGSTEQHGPTGLIGTDAICGEAVGRKLGEVTGTLVAPTIAVGMAQHHLGFPGSMTATIDGPATNPLSLTPTTLQLEEQRTTPRAPPLPKYDEPYWPLSLWVLLTAAPWIAVSLPATGVWSFSILNLYGKTRDYCALWAGG